MTGLSVSDVNIKDARWTIEKSTVGITDQREGVLQKDSFCNGI